MAVILIAEDEPLIVESLTFLLTRAGHTVSAVADGKSAIARIGAVAPDLLLLDIMLPALSGFDVLQHVRSNPKLAKTPVLILTAKGQEADRARMEALGCDDFITKPFSNRDLISRIERLLMRSNAADATNAASAIGQKRR